MKKIIKIKLYKFYEYNNNEIQGGKTFTDEAKAIAEIKKMFNEYNFLCATFTKIKNKIVKGYTYINTEDYNYTPRSNNCNNGYVLTIEQKKAQGGQNE